jgi:hypothetical protein
MNRPKLFKSLRITWSVTWGILAVLLCVLWVRSYFGRTTYQILVTPNYRCYLHSLSGTLAFERAFRPFLGVEVFPIYEESDFLYLKTNAGIKVHRNDIGDGIHAVSASYWLLVIASLAAAAAPWAPWRFSLRTLFIAITLLGMLLGLIVWSMR